LRGKKFREGYFYIAEHKKDGLQNPEFLMGNSLLFFGLEPKGVGIDRHGLVMVPCAIQKFFAILIFING